jgi:transcriptional regulator with PAS, ATPase and Fis domain
VLAGRRGARATDAGSLVAEDPRMRRVLDLVRRVAPTPVAVLIEGETGAGKEVVARALHELSAAARRPFLAVNAAALPDTLLESELFGHGRGAFTGADSEHAGIFEQARGGTVFLDEVASMSLAFQGKLLRVLQDKLVRPLGGVRDVPVDFRLVTATNRDLGALIKSGAFREDLFYRLRVVTIHVPTLRERPGDVVPLALTFLARATAVCLGAAARVPELTKDAIDALVAHRWPGNVRELENAMQHAVVVCAGDRILPHHLGLGVGAWDAGSAAGADDYEDGKRRAVERFQREFVQRALETAKGNVTQAAQSCGLTRAAFQRILKQLGIERAAFAGD